MELKTARNCHARYHLNYHLIMVTKYRKRCITQDLFLSLKDQLEKIAKMNGAEILEIAYEPDHVHILLEAPPQACLSEMINAMKTTSSRKVRKEFPDYLAKYYWKPYFWSRSYLILSRRGADRSDPHLHTRAGNRRKKERRLTPPDSKNQMELAPLIISQTKGCWQSDI